METKRILVGVFGTLGLLAALVAAMVATGARNPLQDADGCWRWDQPCADYHAGLRAVDEERWDDAQALAVRYAETDDPNFLHLQAQIHLYGPEQLFDEAEGLSRQRRAAEAGHHRAAYFLAEYLYFQAPEESNKRVEFLAEVAQNAAYAAECGMPDALYLSGILYAEGTGVEKSNIAALTLFEAAAVGGHIGAQVNAAYIAALLAEQGASLDMEFAYRSITWTYIASSNGNATAQANWQHAMQEFRLDPDTDAAAAIAEITRRGEELASTIEPMDPSHCP
jgi:TPR repeat protein